MNNIYICLHIFVWELFQYGYREPEKVWKIVHEIIVEIVDVT